MTDISEPMTALPAGGRIRRLLPVLLAVAGLAAGLGTTLTGLWSPLSLIGRDSAPAPAESPALPAVHFVEVPRILLSLPGERPRTLAMSVLIDVTPASEALARQLMPRLSDAFTTFLADIDPAAFERRGILDIVRLELATRARFVLGEEAVRDLLITEYRIQ